jgi:hypothetical protein
MMKKFWGGVALTALTVAISTPAMAQQTTSALRGELSGPDGQPVANATVVVTHVPTGTVSRTTTDADGQFDARNLRVGGPYTVIIDAPEFETAEVTDIFLTAGETFSFNYGLEAINIEQEIVVTAQRVGGRGLDTGAETILNRDAIEGVASVRRDIRDLVRRDPLATQNRSDGGISIAGSNPRTNRITIDGVQAQDDFGLNTGGLSTRRGPISIDAVEQVVVQAAPFDVEEGDFLGGSVNLVLRSGTNEFEGSIFAKYLNEGLQGTLIRSTQSRPLVSQTNYGGFIGGPIIRDRLFFALSYETYESLNTTTTGVGPGFTNPVNFTPGVPVTQAQIDEVVNIFNTTYAARFNVGTIPLTQPITDEKYSAKIDWNITDQHRASVTFRNAESGDIVRTNINATSAGLSSQWYLTGETDRSLTGELNSDWTDNFNTQLRVTRREYQRLQEPPGGQDFADVIVCLQPTSIGAVEQCQTGGTPTQTTAVVRFGADQFRHANFLETANDQYQFRAEYSIGDLVLKAGFQRQVTEVFNLFVPRSDGLYYFDSVADFRAGRANDLQFNNAVSGNANDAAAQFAYTLDSLYAQGTWDVPVPQGELTVQGGLRYDFYSSEDEPALNPNFVARYGFSNQQTYDGINILMPRLGINYRPVDNIRIAGGIGLFSGGLPDVFLSNSFSNTGILTNEVRIRRNADGTFSDVSGAAVGFTQAAGATALNLLLSDPRTFFDTPAAVQALLGTQANVSPLAPTATIAPDFTVASDWKGNISLNVDAFDGWRFGLDYVAIRSRDAIAFRDLRAQPLVVNGVIQRTPDGRIRYDGLPDASAANTTARQTAGISSRNLGGNTDVQLFNGGERTSDFLSLSAQRSWDNGIDLFAAWTTSSAESFQDGDRFGATPGTLYNNGVSGLDPNSAVQGRAQEEIENNFKLELGWRRNFFTDLETRFSLFGESRTGRPRTFTMGDIAGGRSAVFGTARGSNYLAYIPNLNNPVTQTSGVVTTDDTVAVFATRADYDAVLNQVRALGLPQGQILPKGFANNPDINRLDFTFSQELPGVLDGHRTIFEVEIENVLNLMNSEWGIQEEFGETTRLFNVTCADTAGAAVTGVNPTCARYRISAPNAAFNNLTPDSDRSRWYIQLGLRYRF